jgi:hypothetical protein
MAKLVQAIGGPPPDAELRKPTLAERLGLNRKSVAQPAVKMKTS